MRAASREPAAAAHGASWPLCRLAAVGSHDRQLHALSAASSPRREKRARYPWINVVFLQSKKGFLPPTGGGNVLVRWYK